MKLGKKLRFLKFFLPFISSFVCGYSTSVANEVELRAALITVLNAQEASNLINFTSNITLTSGTPCPVYLKQVSDTLSIEGNGFTLSGGNSFRGFTIERGVVEINNLNFSSMIAQGGNGGSGASTGCSGGGGGLGAGSAVFVGSQGNVTITDCNFVNTFAASGGAGGPTLGSTTAICGGGGGGGVRGPGGSGANSGAAGGGGGFVGTALAASKNATGGGGLFGLSGGSNGVTRGGSGGGGGLPGNDGTVVSSTSSTGGNGGIGVTGSTAAAGGAANTSGTAGSDYVTGGGGGGGGGSTSTAGLAAGAGGAAFFAGGGGGGGTVEVSSGTAGAKGAGGAGGLFGGGGGGGGGVGTLGVAATAGAGGAGGGYGGGGGSSGVSSTNTTLYRSGGAGGFGGGGGGAGSVTASTGTLAAAGGAGGFGGGGGGGARTAGATGTRGLGGLGGGNGGAGSTNRPGGGGGGAALGGVLFVRNGGALSLVRTGVPGGTLTPGTGGTGGNAAATGAQGQALGTSMFINGNSSVTINVDSGSSTIGGSIFDDQNLIGSGTRGNASITKQGTGTLLVKDAIYLGGSFIIAAGTVQLDVSGDIGAPLVVNGVFNISGVGSLAGATDLSGNGSILIGAKSLYLGSNSNSTFSGVISDTSTSSSVFKVGTAALTLTGVNTYSGTTTITDGSIILSGSGTLGNGTAASSSVPAPLIMGGGNLTIAADAGGKTVGTLSGSSTLSTINLNNNTLTVVQSSNGNLPCSISGTGGGLIINGPGVLTLNLTNSYTGNTTIAGTTNGGLTLGGGTFGNGTGRLIMTSGLLTLPSAANRTIGGLSGAGGTINLNSSTLIVNQATDATYEGTMSGTGGGITVNGAGVLTLTAANTYTGTTTIAGTTNGGITLSSAGTLGDGTGALVMNSGALILTTGIGPRSVSKLSGSGGTISLNDNTLTVSQTSTGTFAGTITGSGGLTINGNTGSPLVLTAAQSYTGATSIVKGNLSLSVSGDISTSSGLDLAGSTNFDISGVTSSATITNLTGLSTSTITLGTKTLLVGTSTDTTFAGVISDSGSGGAITKQNSGSLTLTGVNTYVGPTTVTGGTIVLSGSGTLGNGAATSSASPAPLALNGGNFTIDISAGNKSIGTLSNNTSLSVISLNNNTLSINQGSDQTYSGTMSGTGGGLTVSGGVGVLTLTAANTYTGITTIAGTTNGGITLSSSGTIGDGTGSLVMNSGLLTLTSSIGSRIVAGLSGAGGTINLNNNTFNIAQGSDGTYAGTISGTGGSLTVSGTGILTLTAANTYTGPTTIAGSGPGGVTLSSSGTLGATTAPLVMNSGFLTLTSGIGIRSVGGLSGAGGTINLNNNTLSINQGSNATYFGTMIGTGGGITINGAGILTLTAANSYSGTTTIAGTTNGGITLSSSGTIGDGTGSLVMNSGLLTLTSSIGSRSVGGLGGAGGTINLNNNTFNIAQGSDATYAGTISGTGGSLNVIGGAGVLTLTAANTYTGTTTIAGSGSGGVTLSSSGTLGATTVPLVMNSGLLILTSDLGSRSVGGLSGAGGTINLNNNTFNIAQGSDATYAGTISGTGGSITINGSGILTLTAANSYSGTTTITGTTNGGITLSSSGTLGDGTGNLVMNSGLLTLASGIGLRNIGRLSGASGTINLNNNTISINQGSNATYAGTISGTGGGLTVSGGVGVLTLTAANSYSGTTTIAGSGSGGITLSSSGTLGDGTGNLVMNSGLLTLTSGIGSRSVGGLGGAGGTINLNNNTFNITQGSDATYSGTISGSGVFNKSGVAKLNLLGDSSSFSGQTNILAGKIIVDGPDGNLQGTTTIFEEARLQGTGGRLGTVINNGIIGPGSASSAPDGFFALLDGIGTLIIEGDYTQGVDALLEIEINHLGQTDLISIIGSANLNGYVHALPEDGLYVQGTEFLFLTAGAGYGSTRFINIIEDHPQEFLLEYRGNNVYLVVKTDFIISSFSSLLTGNAKRTYDYLFYTVNSNNQNLSELQAALVALPTLSSLTFALEQLCPALYSALPLVSFQNNVRVAQANLQQAISFGFDSCSNTDINFWMTPIGFYYNQKGVQQEFGFDNYSYGFTTGTVIGLGSSLFVNPSISYTHSNTKWNNNCGKAFFNSLYFTPSIGYSNDVFFADAILQASIDFYKMTRNVDFTGFNTAPQSRFKSYNFLMGFELGSKLELKNFEPNQLRGRKNFNNQEDKIRFFIQPQAQLYFVKLYQESFTEGGNSYINLQVRHKSTTFLQPNIGLKWIQEILVNDYCLSPVLYLGYLSNIPIGPTGIISKFYQLSIPLPHFSVEGYNRVVNQLSLGFEFNVFHCNDFKLCVGYNLDFLSHMNVQMINLSFNWSF